MEPIMICPHCKSANIKPGKVTWHCNDCGKDFSMALATDGTGPPEATDKPK